MEPIRLFRTLAFVALAAGGVGAGAQDPELQHAERDSNLVLERYQVQYVNARELYNTFQDLVEDWSSPTRPTSRMLGDTIVIYAPPADVQRARELLVKLDVKPQGEAPSARGMIEYKPRFVSMDTVISTIESYVSDWNVISERGMVLLSGSNASLAVAKSMIERVDIPERQVLLSCLLIEVGYSEGPALPPELTENLQKLLPENSAFAQVGMAMLKTSVGAGKTISLQIQSNRTYRFSCMPVAFDEASGSLTVSECSLFDVTGEDELFSTSTVLRGGEYTVLAATGAEPRLLVVRVMPLP